MRSEVKRVGHLGVGGIKCPCCRPGNGMSKREAVTVLNRRFRRAAKRQIQNELAESTSF